MPVTTYKSYSGSKTGTERQPQRAKLVFTKNKQEAAREAKDEFKDPGQHLTPPIPQCRRDTGVAYRVPKRRPDLDVTPDRDVYHEYGQTGAGRYGERHGTLLRSRTPVRKIEVDTSDIRDQIRAEMRGEMRGELKKMMAEMLQAKPTASTQPLNNDEKEEVAAILDKTGVDPDIARQVRSMTPDQQLAIADRLQSIKRDYEPPRRERSMSRDPADVAEARAAIEEKRQDPEFVAAQEPVLRAKIEAAGH